MKRYIFLLPLVAIAVFSCNGKANPVKPDNHIPELIREWVNSFEEEIDSISIYRPSDYKQFPAARYRDGFSLQSDGTCRYMVLSPDDGHYSVAGTWSVSVPGDTIVEIRDSVGCIHYILKVIALRSDVLRVIKLGVDFINAEES